MIIALYILDRLFFFNTYSTETEINRSEALSSTEVSYSITGAFTPPNCLQMILSINITISVVILVMTGHVIEELSPKLVLQHTS